LQPAGSAKTGRGRDSSARPNKDRTEPNWKTMTERHQTLPLRSCEVSCRAADISKTPSLSTGCPGQRAKFLLEQGILKQVRWMICSRGHISATGKLIEGCGAFPPPCRASKVNHQRPRQQHGVARRCGLQRWETATSGIVGGRSRRPPRSREGDRGREPLKEQTPGKKTGAMKGLGPDAESQPLAGFSLAF